jgi:hypothetical protein
LIALFEIGNLLKYLQTLDDGIQQKLKSVINSYQEFQNLFFEIYVYRILDYNRIENDKKVWKGNQELDGACKIGDREFIFECRKSYTVDFERLAAVMGLATQISLEVQKMKTRKELIGYIRIKKNIEKAKKKILNILSQFFRQFDGRPDFSIRSYHDDNDCQFETMIYDEKRYFELDNQEERPEIIFKIISPMVAVQGELSWYKTIVSPAFSINQNKITEKLLITIKKKRQQHSLSKDSNRIIFIDCEQAKNFRFPLLSSENMIDEDRIQREINRKETNDIICIILRDYLGQTPTVKLKIFCKKEFDDVKHMLEKLKTPTDYTIIK